MASNHPFSADELVLMIKILTETKGAVSNVKLVEDELKRLRAEATQTKASLKGLFDKGVISNETYQRAVKKVNTELGETPAKVDNVKKSLLSMDNVARTAFGTFVAMGIFLVTQFVGQAINKVLDSLKQLELSFYKIAIAEASLSKSGVDIIPQDLLDIAKEISDTFSFVSNIDAMKIVGQVSLLTKDLKLTKEQIRELSIAIPALARSTGESIEETTAAIATGIAKNGRGLADQNVQVNAQIISQKALELGLVASEEAYKNLTAEQKQYIDVSALVSIISDAANESLAKQGDLADSVTDKTGQLSQAWETFTTETGKTFAPFIKGGLDLLIGGLKILQYSLLGTKVIFLGWVALMVSGLYTVDQFLKGNIHSLKEFNAIFKSSGLEAMKQMNEMMSGPGVPEDTPTGIPTSNTDEVEKNTEDLKGALEKANDEILKAQLKLEQDLTDVAIDLGRKMEDITIEYAQKRADAEADYAEKIHDINSSYADKISDIERKSAESKDKFRNDQLEKEREFQNKLKEMREDFLMDLEDALHARDARQILKLIKQYELEKLQAQRKHDLDMSNSKRDEQLRQKGYAAEKKEAEQERKRKLAEAQHDYQLKLAKLKAEEDAEVKAAVLSANRKTQDLIKSNHDRLAIIAADLVNQFNLTKMGLDAILGLYMMYYGDGGFISQVMAGMQATLAGQANINTNTTTEGLTNKKNNGLATHMAEGGTIIANRPTTVTFGERGYEEASFRPIGRTGKDVNKIFSALGGSGDSGMGGMVTIALDLSPDLESRIVSNTLSETARVITKTRRSKN